MTTIHGILAFTSMFPYFISLTSSKGRLTTRKYTAPQVRQWMLWALGMVYGKMILHFQALTLWLTNFETPTEIIIGATIHEKCLYAWNYKNSCLIAAYVRTYIAIDGLHEHLDFPFAIKGYSKFIASLSEVTPMTKLATQTSFNSFSNKWSTSANENTFFIIFPHQLPQEYNIYTKRCEPNFYQPAHFRRIISWQHRPKWSFWILGNHHKYDRPIFDRKMRCRPAKPGRRWDTLIKSKNKKIQKANEGRIVAVGNLSDKNACFADISWGRRTLIRSLFSKSTYCTLNNQVINL